ncbi:MAG TPA: protein kinase, partial [Gaiellaceae bacterium]|nr:protein kinase [Gaiellaceae bacterium]
MTRVAGRYEVVRPLGHGAMATVDLAHDVELDRPVALKRLAENLSRDEDLRRRFVREARLAARLAHPNVVRVFDVGEDDGRPFIAM